MVIIKRYVLRRKIASASETFDDELDVFGSHMLDSPEYNQIEAWHSWIREADIQEKCLKMYLLKISKRKRKIDIRMRKNKNDQAIL